MHKCLSYKLTRRTSVSVTSFLSHRLEDRAHAKGQTPTRSKATDTIRKNVRMCEEQEATVELDEMEEEVEKELRCRKCRKCRKRRNWSGHIGRGDRRKVERMGRAEGSGREDRRDRIERRNVVDEEEERKESWRGEKVNVKERVSGGAGQICGAGVCGRLPRKAEKG